MSQLFDAITFPLIDMIIIQQLVSILSNLLHSCVFECAFYRLSVHGEFQIVFGFLNIANVVTVTMECEINSVCHFAYILILIGIGYDVKMSFHSLIIKMTRWQHHSDTFVFWQSFFVEYNSFLLSNDFFHSSVSPLTTISPSRPFIFDDCLFESKKAGPKNGSVKALVILRGGNLLERKSHLLRPKRTCFSHPFSVVRVFSC